MMKDLMNKLKSSNGDSIAEVLVAILITALATIVFATMVSSSVQMIEKSSETMNDYYASISTPTKTTGNVNVTFKNTSGTPVTIGGQDYLLVDVYGKTDDAKYYRVRKSNE